MRLRGWMGTRRVRLPLSLSTQTARKFTDPQTEEEKKIIAALLGKLYVSPASSEPVTRDVYAVVCDAVNTQLLADATSRNSLYKLHVNLGKIVNTLDAAADGAAGAGKGHRSVSRASSVGLGGGGTPAAEDKTIVQHEVQIKEEEVEDEDDDAGTVVHRTPEQSLVDELLSEEEEEL